MVDVIHHVTYSRLEYASIINDRRDILKRHNNFKVRRHANDCVHALAMMSISYAPHSDFHYPS